MTTLEERLLIVEEKQEIVLEILRKNHLINVNNPEMTNEYREYLRDIGRKLAYGHTDALKRHNRMREKQMRLQKQI
jgi:hypothetical protein